MIYIFKILSKKAITAFQKGTVVTLCIVLTALFMTASCEKPRTEPDPDPDPTEPATIIVNLTDTKWKLVEFVQVSEGTTKIPESIFKRDPYWITFNCDSTITGYASINKLSGDYQMDTLVSTIRIDIGIITYALEHPDGDLYIERLNLVSSFELIELSLKLYYNETDYLLFNAQDDEN
jgi:hypothetical protein